MTKQQKIQSAIDALPNATGDWWVEERGCGFLFSDPVGSVNIAKYVDGGSLEEMEANKILLSAARDLAEEVVRLQGGIHEAIETIITLIGGGPPDPNCTCPVIPPCSDCIEHHYNREALADLRALVAMEDSPK